VGINVYFADPHSPRQRPSNEHFNGTLRRYVGKGTDLSVYSQADLDLIGRRINTMPRESSTGRQLKIATMLLSLH
jgi:IS30 family transposase